MTPQVGKRGHQGRLSQGGVGRKVSSHAGSEMKLGYTQVIFPTVQDDAGLEGVHQGVWVSWGHVS